MNIRESIEFQFLTKKERGSMYFMVSGIEGLVGDDKHDGEIPIMALRRRIVEGKVTRTDLFKSRGFGNKSYRSLLETLELEEKFVVSK